MKKLIALLLCSLCFSSCVSDEVFQWYIFSNIEECTNIELYKHADAKLEHYSTTPKDRKLKDLPYNSFYGIKYTSDELSFEMFAYEFQSEAAAKEYFKNITGQSLDLDSGFSTTSGLTCFEAVVYDGKNAYTVYTSRQEEDELRTFFQKVFSVNIMDRLNES